MQANLAARDFGALLADKTAADREQGFGVEPCP